MSFGASFLEEKHLIRKEREREREVGRKRLGGEGGDKKTIPFKWYI